MPVAMCALGFFLYYYYYSGTPSMPFHRGYGSKWQWYYYYYFNIRPMNIYVYFIHIDSEYPFICIYIYTTWVCVVYPLSPPEKLIINSLTNMCSMCFHLWWYSLLHSLYHDDDCWNRDCACACDGCKCILATRGRWKLFSLEFDWSKMHIKSQKRVFRQTGVVC